MTDAKTIALTWLLRFAEKQGIAILLAVGISLFFGWKMHRLEERLDACQSAKEDARIARIERVVESSEAVIRAIETLIGRLDQAPTSATSSSRIKTRIQ